MEVHPFFQQESTVKFAQDLGLKVTAYSPLGSGAVINGMRVIDHPELAAIGEKHGKSPAQVVTAWLLARNIVVIPKSVKQERIQQNLDVIFTLDAEDIGKISALNADARCVSRMENAECLALRCAGLAGEGHWLSVMAKWRLATFHTRNIHSSKLAASSLDSLPSRRSSSSSSTIYSGHMIIACVSVNIQVLQVIYIFSFFKLNNDRSIT